MNLFLLDLDRDRRRICGRRVDVRDSPPNAKRDHFFIEVERGAGVFAFLGTAFAVLLAFVVLEAFGSFNDARTGAESEATARVELSRNSEFFSRADRELFAAG